MARHCLMSHNNLTESPSKFYCILHLLSMHYVPGTFTCIISRSPNYHAPYYKGGINIFSIQMRVNGLGI